MKNLHCWFRRSVFALVVVGCAVQASATLCLTAGDLLSRMIPGSYFDVSPPDLASGGGSGYTYTGSLVNNGSDALLSFTGSPTGVGGAFDPGTLLTFTFTGTSAQSPLQVTVGSSGFLGFTTDVDPSVLSISTLEFSASSQPSRLIGGLDIAIVPETSTLLAGALLLLPFGASTLRFMRRNRRA